MRKGNKVLLTAATVLMIFSYQIYYLIPGRVTVREGEKYNFPPFISSVENENGTQLRFMGLLPLRTVKVNVLEKTTLIPCGNTIGIKINVKGLLVVGLSEIRCESGRKYSPAQAAGLRKGDVIRSINDLKTETTSSLSAIIEKSGGETLNIETERNGRTIHLSVSPDFSTDDKAYKIGAWVRDSTSGIGTITYIDPNDNSFGALGHGITDADTGGIIPAGDGEVLRSEIIGIKKGERGSPGELKGVFASSGKIGKVNQNTETGVFGSIVMQEANKEPVPIGIRSQVHLGEAKILSNIEGEKVEEYSIEIQKVMKNAINNKGMVIRITDERLLKKTGGIVQGMSGSPIIQDGRLIGAVTHVFINDPTRGYGAFIELMLSNQ